MKYSKVFKLLAFLLCNINLNDMGIIINKYEKILFTPKIYRYYWFYDHNINIQIGLYYISL